MAAPLIGNVSDTAFWVAHHRALESERADALFRDPLAGVLAGDRGRQIADEMPQPQMTSWAIVIRTCIIDDFIRSAIAQGADTILNLGAGLDTRPYRMELPRSLAWIEVDYPDVIALKESRLSGEAPGCELNRVKLDLANVSARRQMLAGVNARAKKMLVLTEGVIPYLSVEDVGSLADDLRSLDRARWWLVDYFSPQVMKMRRRRMAQKMQNAPFKFEPDDWTGFFEKHGWRCGEMRYLAAESERLRREMPLPLIAKAYLSIRRVFLRPRGRHAIAAGVDALATIEIDGNVGYYCAGMNKQATVVIKGSAGVGVAENMMSGHVHVKGDASQSAGATGCGGLLVIDGNASARCGISIRGLDIVVKGSVGHMSAFMAQAGTLVVLDGAGEALGDSIYEARLFVRGEVKSLGVDCSEKPLCDSHKADLRSLLDKAGVGGKVDISEFKRFGSARQLYHFHIDNVGAY